MFHQIRGRFHFIRSSVSDGFFLAAQVVASLGREINLNPPLVLGQLPDTSEELLKLDQVCTVLVLRIVHRKWKETKQQPSMLPVPAVPGYCLVSFHILWAILSTSTVHMCRENFLMKMIVQACLFAIK